MIDKHACSAQCPCQQGRDKAIAERVTTRVLDQQIAARVAGAYVLALDVGQGTFTKYLKLHHFHGSLRITDMQNAGKRGKKVRELVLVPHGNDDFSDKVIKQAVSSILHMNYDQAKSHLEDILKREGHENLFRLDEVTMRGIDVEPMGTTINLEKKFPDGTILSIKSSPHDFHVTNSVVMGAPAGKPSFRQDTSYWPVKKQDGIIFYGWLQDNLSKAAHMTLLELTKVWQELGIHYNSH